MHNILKMLCIFKFTMTFFYDKIYLGDVYGTNGSKEAANKI